jgi:hypothetical protein
LTERAQSLRATGLVVDQFGNRPLRSGDAVDPVDDALHLDTVPFRRARSQLDFAALPAGAAGIAPMQPFDVARREAREGGGKREKGRDFEMAFLLHLMRDVEKPGLFLAAVPGSCLVDWKRCRTSCNQVPKSRFSTSSSSSSSLRRPSIRKA